MFRGDENETEQQRAIEPSERRAAVPGVLVVVVASEPACHWVPIGDRRLQFGRSAQADIPIDDPKLSRRHFAIARDNGRWVVSDEGSQNGTHVSGARIVEPVALAGSVLIRAADSLFLALEDGSRFAHGEVRIENGHVMGPSMEPVLRIVKDAGRRGDTLLVLGETGTGKDVLATVHHEASGRGGPFFARNVATIPPSIAESTLFGAKRGAYSGRDSDQEGLLVAANGGTLFLDEVGDMPIELQTKFLRVLETGEVIPLGTNKTTRVDVRVVSATRRDLDALVDDGKFGPDLRERLSRRVVTLPPLRDRPEAIAFLVKMFVRAVPGAESLPITPEFYEACIAFHWRDRNIRGLRNAVEAAAKDGLEFDHPALVPGLLPGFVTAPRAASVPPPAIAQPPPPSAPPTSVPPTAASPKQLLLARLLAAYEKHRGKVRKAAEEVGISRQRAYVLLREAGVVFSDEDASDD